MQTGTLNGKPIYGPRPTPAEMEAIAKDRRFEVRELRACLDDRDRYYVEAWAVLTPRHPGQFSLFNYRKDRTVVEFILSAAEARKRLTFLGPKWVMQYPPRDGATMELRDENGARLIRWQEGFWHLHIGDGSFINSTEDMLSQPTPLAAALWANDSIYRQAWWPMSEPPVLGQNPA